MSASENDLPGTSPGDETPADNTPADPDPKLVVDSDWKEQVEREKQTSDAASIRPDELPPPGLEFLVSMLMSQAMSYLGAIPGLSGENAPINKPMAKHTIDTLEVLQEKTQGNLSAEEAKMIGEILHVLRMAYVNAR